MYLYTLIKYLSEIVIYYAVMNCSFSQNAFLLPLPTSLFNAMSKWRFQILKLFLYFLTLPFCGRLPRSYWVWGAQVEGTCPDSSLADHQSPLIQSLGTLSPQDLLLNLMKKLYCIRYNYLFLSVSHFNHKQFQNNIFSKTHL